MDADEHGYRAPSRPDRGIVRTKKGDVLDARTGNTWSPREDVDNTYRVKVIRITQSRGGARMATVVDKHGRHQMLTVR